MDSTLRKAASLIDSGHFRLLSLDIFDTVVWRTFPAPADLFLALGSLLLQAGRLPPSASAASFAAERMEAERLARLERKSDGEVTLREIYAHFPPGYLLDGGADAVHEAELALEHRSTHPDRDMLTLIRHARSQGLAVACVSDTYFDPAYLARILPFEPDHLVASSAFRKSKAAGLHAELVALSGIPPAQILHIGDNRPADLDAPKRLGIEALWRPRFSEDEERRRSGELPSVLAERAMFYTSGHGDGGITRARSEALASLGPNSSTYVTWGASVLGPTIAPFSRWVLDRCAEQNIDTVLCLMREGRVLKRTLDAFCEPVSTLEFFTSRFALIHASVLTGSSEELRRFLARPQPTSARDLLEPLGLKPFELGLDQGLLVDAEMARTLSERIAGAEKLRQRCVDASRTARSRFLAYWKACVPDSASKVAVVDLGYSGTIQQCLQEILNHEQIHCRTHGLYLVTGSGIRRVQAIAPAEGFLAQNGQPVSIAHSFMRSPEIVEQALMCDLGTTLGYDGAGAPILGEQLIDQQQRNQTAEVQEGLRIFTEHYAANWRHVPCDPLQLRPFIEAILIRGLTNPTKAELEAFGAWKHDENIGSKRSRSLVQTELEREYLQHASAHQFASLPSSDTYWIFGAAHNQNPVLGDAVRNILLRKVEPWAFNDTNEQLPIHFFWNDGSARRADQVYRLSSRRTAWTRFSLQMNEADLSEIGFSAGRPGDLINLAAVFLRLQGRGARTSVIRKAPREFESFGVEALDDQGNLFRVTDIPGWATAVGIRQFTGTVHVDFLFSHFERSAPCLS